MVLPALTTRRTGHELEQPGDQVRSTTSTDVTSTARARASALIHVAT
jgi:hypothetical protein